MALCPSCFRVRTSLSDFRLGYDTVTPTMEKLGTRIKEDVNQFIEGVIKHDPRQHHEST